MQITVEISEQFAAKAADLGLTPEAYAYELLSRELAVETEWEAEALRRAGEIDNDPSRLVPWEQIESKLRSQIAG